ncbi:MAG: GTP cyclohydrolase I FolE [Acidobacteria bacterium]|nr:GTP cyclohydrolase I FolE [Acidobacteriota bacterium]
MDKDKMEEIIKNLILECGEDPTREGLRRTPLRVREAYEVLTSGYKQNVDEIVKEAVFSTDYDEMVIVKDIDIFSMCEHHLLPFFGKAHVAYIPNKKILGLSKIVRIAEMYSRRFQVQERLTNQIAHTLQDHLKPLGVGVVVEAQHLCMMMRGVEKQNSIAVTSAMLGSFREKPQTRNEFLQLIGKQ